MAKKGGLGRSLADIMASEPQGERWHPVLSPIAFAAATERTGGATIDVNTGAQVDTDNPAADTYIVGKEPDTAGRPIPTTSIRSADILTKTNALRKEIVAKTGARPGTSIGSWKTKGGAVDIDASAMEPNKKLALAKATDRNEKAIFSTKKFRKSGKKYNGDIPNPNYKAE
jgi:hypothetical protein